MATIATTSVVVSTGSAIVPAADEVRDLYRASPYEHVLTEQAGQRRFVTGNAVTFVKATIAVGQFSGVVQASQAIGLFDRSNED